MDYCTKLKFEEEPDYNYLKMLIKTVALREQIDLNDRTFDWSKKLVQSVIRSSPKSRVKFKSLFRGKVPNSRKIKQTNKVPEKMYN
jgi:hypothetical protein